MSGDLKLESTMQGTEPKISEREAEMILDSLSRLMRLGLKQQLLRLIVYWIRSGLTFEPAQNSGGPHN
jgi:hypothetical protein